MTQTKSRGVATLLALTCVLLIGSALVVLSRQTVADLVRTGGERRDAQLRQLLIAGETQFLATLTAGDPPPNATLVAPADAGRVLIETSVTDQTAAGRLSAEFGGMTMTSRVTARRTGDGWALVEAILLQPKRP